MNKKKIIIICSIVLILAIGLFLSTGSARTDVYLKEFSFDEKCNQITIKVGISSSAGYVRKMKRTGGSMNYYYTFYSTFGINSKLGAEDTFEIQLDNNVDEIYFYTGGKGYKKVLEKNDNGDWVNVENKYANLLTLDKLKEIVAEKGENLTWSDFEKYSSTDVGFGMYVRLYNINEDYNLYIGGANVEEDPMYINLKSTKDENRFIDIREGNIDDFLNMKENEIIETYNESVENHIYCTYYKMSDETWKVKGCSYKYRLEITGRLPNAIQDTTFVYLSNIEEISFEQAYLTAGVSSNINDYFDEREAILVEMY